MENGVTLFNADGPHRPVVLIGTFPDLEDRYFENFAGALDGERPLYYLRPPAVEGRNHLVRVEHWLDHFRPLVESSPVEPPYLLLGYSFGGLVAMELARRLIADDVAVDYVGMIDTARPVDYPRTVGAKLLSLASGAHQVPPDRRRAYLREEARSSLRYRRGKAEALLHRFTRRTTDADVTSEPESPLRRAVNISWIKYVGAPIEFPVSLFATHESIKRSADDPSLGWAPWLLGGFEQVTIPGEHFTLFDPPDLHAVTSAVESSLALAEYRLSGHIPQRV